MREERGERREDRGQRTEDRGQRTEETERDDVCTHLITTHANPYS